MTIGNLLIKIHFWLLCRSQYLLLCVGKSTSFMKLVNYDIATIFLHVKRPNVKSIFNHCRYPKHLSRYLQIVIYLICKNIQHGRKSVNCNRDVLNSIYNPMRKFYGITNKNNTGYNILVKVNVVLWPHL